MFTENEFSISTYNLINVKMYINLIKEISIINKNLKLSALKYSIKLFFHLNSDINPLLLFEIKKAFLDLLIYFLQIGNKYYY
jgi:hypothetical protein